MSARARTGAISGAVAQFLALNVAFLGTVVGLFFAPAALGQATIEMLPGAISIPLIEALQHWAQRLLVIAVLAAFLVVGAVAGALARDPERSDTAVLAIGASPWLLAIALPALFAASQVPIAGVIADAALGAATFAGVLSLLGTAAPQGETEPVAGRRRALVALGVLGVVVAGGSLLFAQSLRAVGARGALLPLVARRLRHAEPLPPADPAFDAIERLTRRRTDIGEHYTVDTALIDPRVDERRWSLEVSGEVERPFRITYEELLDIEAVEQLHTLECISNEIGGELISTALWTGVPLRDLLARAGVRPSARDVVLTSVDGYSDSITLAKALEPRTIVAYIMDGYTLPEEHGFPARVLVPDIYGMKNVKWLASIHLVPHDFQGYWMERGWSDVATVNTRARIDTDRHVRWDGGAVTIAGIANAGARGISKVEVSLDGGASWADADLEPPLGPLTWVRWRYRWTPPATGTYNALVRATDGNGRTQTATSRPPFPAGATGYHRAELRVTR